MQITGYVNETNWRIIASHDSSEDYTIISIKKADFVGYAWPHIHNRKGFHFSAN